ncbi:PQQ-dependent sugar dehydrogenase [Arenibaculum pallidiluteum]|uniref:PQQ-dependent sugar dehydrogenase n=1 Tax=Arenibaculum pallidiluteum TaxID=2812559 RepID=UPI001A977355|nr:PQQ-dependent sugar dehydrogenase [Arenibaculum pallidiluteum]
MLRTLLAASTALAIAAGLVATAQAQTAAPADNIEKLRQFKGTGAPLEIKQIPQEGRKADQLRKNLEKVKLPPGFRIELYAVVPDARHMAVGTNAGVVFVGTRKSDVWAVTDRDRDRVGDEVKRFAPSINLKVPNGTCFSPDGFLYVVEHNRIMVYPAAEFFYESPDVAVDVVVPQGELIPPEEESFNHGARTCVIGPDNKLYVTLGQPFNVPAPEKLSVYDKWGIGGIIRMDRDGKNREVLARGVRNSVGMDVNPANGQLWFTDNQVDGMGDDKPAGELNRLTQVGQNFGFPWYGGGRTQTAEYQGKEPPQGVVFPEVEMDAHAADLGMTFYRGEAFPAKYRNGIFSAQHGSWNRTKPIGARVMFTPVKEDGSAGQTEIFADGWLQPTGEYLGRPVDVKMMQDGSLLVSDDFAGAIYRISYSAQ